MKEHRTTEEEMEGSTSFLRIKEQETRLTLHEHDDDDDFFVHGYDFRLLSDNTSRH
jgi:hypothetical protein